MEEERERKIEEDRWMEIEIDIDIGIQRAKEGKTEGGRKSEED